MTAPLWRNTIDVSTSSNRVNAILNSTFLGSPTSTARSSTVSGTPSSTPATDHGTLSVSFFFFSPRRVRTSQQCSHEHLETRRIPTLTEHIMHRRSGTTNSSRRTIQQRHGEGFGRSAPQQATPPVKSARFRLRLEQIRCREGFGGSQREQELSRFLGPTTANLSSAWPCHPPLPAPGRCALSAFWLPPGLLHPCGRHSA